MSRPPDPQIRRKLCSQAADYVMTHGMWDLSLRPLAAALGTNARMLVYHFGSREGLMKAILQELRRRGDAEVMAWFKKHSRSGSQTLWKFVRWLWWRMNSPEARSAVRLIFELYALALRDPKAFPGVLDVPVRYWLMLAELSGYKGKEAETVATLVLAVSRGLILDAAGTGDRKRVHRAFNALMAQAEKAQRPARRQ